jgi:prepilin peptidase CpaA
LPQPFDPIVAAAVAGCGSTSAIIDLRLRRVPNWLTLGIAVLGVVMAALRLGAVSMAAALVGFALGFALMLPGHFIGATGAGDVKLLAALGTILGPFGILTAFLYAALAGGVLALIVAVRRRSLGVTMERTCTLVRTKGANVAEIESTTTNNRFAYAPAIAIGAIATALGL